MLTGIYLNDEHDLCSGDKIPYIGFELTKEQAKTLKGKKPEIFSADGRTMFDIKDKDGKWKGNKIIYILFI